MAFPTLCDCFLLESDAELLAEVALDEDDPICLATLPFELLVEEDDSLTDDEREDDDELLTDEDDLSEDELLTDVEPVELLRLLSCELLDTLALLLRLLSWELLDTLAPLLRLLS